MLPVCGKARSRKWDDGKSDKADQLHAMAGLVNRASALTRFAPDDGVGFEGEPGKCEFVAVRQRSQFATFQFASHCLPGDFPFAAGFFVHERQCGK